MQSLKKKNYCNQIVKIQTISMSIKYCMNKCLELDINSLNKKFGNQHHKCDHAIIIPLVIGDFFYVYVA